MNLDQFIETYNGKSVANNHGGYKGECVSLAARWAQEGQGVANGDSALYCANTGGARDLYEWYGKAGSNVQNFYDRIPYGQPGMREDLVVWGASLGQYGDVAIAVDGNIYIFGQLGTPVFIPANLRNESRPPLGYLRRKGTNVPPDKYDTVPHGDDVGFHYRNRMFREATDAEKANKANLTWAQILDDNVAELGTRLQAAQANPAGAKPYSGPQLYIKE